MSVDSRRRRVRRDTLLAHPVIREYLFRTRGALPGGKHALGRVPLRAFGHMLPKKTFPK